jgi:hypothetical protein
MINETYTPDRSNPLAVMCDIDGTVALKGNRNPYDESCVDQDQPNEPVVDVLVALIRVGYTPVFISGRTEKCYISTQQWLKKYVLSQYLSPNTRLSPYPPLLMRPEGDNRRDAEVKLELFNKHIRNNYNVRAVLDDRNQVVEMWRSLGLTVLQVAYGDF